MTFCNTLFPISAEERKSVGDRQAKGWRLAPLLQLIRYQVFFKAAGYSAEKKSGKISIPRSKTKLENVPHSGPVLRSRLEPGHFGRSRNRFEGPSPGSGSTLDETEEILNYILFVRSNID